MVAAILSGGVRRVTEVNLDIGSSEYKGSRQQTERESVTLKPVSGIGALSSHAIGKQTTNVQYIFEHVLHAHSAHRVSRLTGQSNVYIQKQIGLNFRRFFLRLDQELYT
jgi:hypothetical protein